MISAIAEEDLSYMDFVCVEDGKARRATHVDVSANTPIHQCMDAQCKQGDTCRIATKDDVFIV